jgi:hypothetical protein
MSDTEAAIACVATAVALLTAGFTGSHLYAQPDPVEACNALSHAVGNDGLQSAAGVCLGELHGVRS